MLLFKHDYQPIAVNKVFYSFTFHKPIFIFQIYRSEYICLVANYESYAVIRNVALRGVDIL